MYHDPRWCCGRPRLVVIASRRIHRQKVPGSSEMPSVKFELTAASLVCKTKSIREAACFTLEGDASIVTRPSSGILWFVLLGLEDGHPPRLPEVLPLWLFCGPCIYLFLLSHGQPLLQIFLNLKVWCGSLSLTCISASCGDSTRGQFRCFVAVASRLMPWRQSTCPNTELLPWVP